VTVKECSYAYYTPGFSPVSAKDTDFTSSDRLSDVRLSKPSISQRMEEHPAFMDFTFFSVEASRQLSILSRHVNK